MRSIAPPSATAASSAAAFPTPDTSQPGGPAGLDAANAAPQPPAPDRPRAGKLAQLATQLPQLARNCATDLAAGLRGLSTAQKLAGGAALALALGWLATRRRPAAGATGTFGNRFGGKPFGEQGRPRYGGGAVQPGYGRNAKY